MAVSGITITQGTVMDTGIMTVMSIEITIAMITEMEMTTGIGMTTAIEMTIGMETITVTVTRLKNGEKVHNSCFCCLLLRFLFS